jgi:hypothetical protein
MDSLEQLPYSEIPILYREKMEIRRDKATSLENQKDLQLFRNDYPENDIDEKSGKSSRDNAQQHIRNPNERRVQIEILCNPATNSGDHAVRNGASKFPGDVHRIVNP